MEEVESAPVKKVLLNCPELLEMILELVLKKNVSKSFILSLRLVHSKWAVAISDIFKAIRKEPLFHLTLNQPNFGKETENSQILNKFVDHVSSPESRIHKFVPLFSLQLGINFFVNGNIKSLSHCFQTCGNGLIELEVFLPIKNCPALQIFQVPDLPRLKKITAHIPESSVYSIPTNLQFLEGIISQTKSLTEFTLGNQTELYRRVQYKMNLPPQPLATVDNLALPSTISRVNLSCEIDGLNLLELLEKLPNLAHLEIRVPTLTSFFPVGLSAVLSKYKSSLKVLSLVGDRSKIITKYLNFPVMKKLEKLEITSAEFELEDPLTKKMEKQFPMLKELVLRNPTTEMIRKWIPKGKWRMKTVESLDINLGSDQRSEIYVHFQILSKIGVKNIHRRFPNLKSLSIDFQITNGGIQPIEYIFKEMTQLTHLKLVLHYSSEVDFNLWDNLFVWTGNQNLANSSTDTGTQTVPGDTASIINLTNLECLTLCQNGEEEDTFEGRCISDAVFTLAFLKMSKLQTMNLGGRFRVSKAMSEEWRKSGRVLNYNS